MSRDFAGTNQIVRIYSLRMKTVARNMWLLVWAGSWAALSGFVGAQPATTPSPFLLDEAAINSFDGVKAPTRASRDATMSYTFPVEIAQVLVKGGQHVKKGDALVQGRDDEYRLQRDLQKT